MTLLEAAQTLVPLRPTGGGEHHGPCPACGEGDDRFWVNEGGGIGGTGRFACRRCGESGTALDFLTRILKMSAARARVELGLDPQQAWAAHPHRLGVEVARYAYRDEEGHPLSDVVRYEAPPDHPLHGTADGKTFRPAAPGGPPSKRPAVPRVLYRLPEVRAAVARGDTVYVCEGEKDADALAALGACATTGEGGAGKWHPGYTEALRGARVVVLPDNDAAGRDHAAKVRTALTGVAEEVVVVALSGLPVKGDVSDWIAAGGSLAALVAEVGEAPRPGLAATTPAPPVAPLPAPPSEPCGRPVLVARPLADWVEEASTKPTPRRLFGDCWFEGELGVLFAETNVGKSILAVQIAHSVSAGAGETAGMAIEAGPEPVLYFDFELSPKQFHGRYSEAYGRPFPFDRRLIRVELGRDFDFEGDWAASVREAIERTVEETGARVVVVDNLTALEDETERAKGALSLMRFLNALKRRYGLSILVIAHTPKRDPSRPVTRNDLAGSRVLLNLADSAFALGESHRDRGTRYLKQIKVRETAFTLDAGNVALLRPEKPGGFLSFAPVGYAAEADHLAAREMKRGRGEKAEEWLAAFLSEGPRPSEEVIGEGRKAGHSRNALFEAKKALCIKARKLGFEDGAWEWGLPEGGDLSDSAEFPKRPVPRNGTLRDASLLRDSSEEAENTGSEAIKSATDDAQREPWDDEDPLGEGL